MARYRARQIYELLSSLLVSAVIYLSLALWGWAVCVSAAQAPSELYLEVSINNHPTKLIAAFLQHPDGRFSATRAELKELAIEAPGNGAPTEQIFLDNIESLSFKYDEAAQKIGIEIKASRMRRNTYKASNEKSAASNAEVATGAVLNYGLYGSIHEHALSAYDFYEGTSLTLDGRVFGSYGTIESSAIVGLADFDSRRVDTTWSYSFTDSLVTVRAGDFVSGGFGWTRPVRMAGFKIERNFDLRPDLITKPLPTVSGSAAVPSTVDVYVNNIKTYSRDVPSGPFTINQLPVISGSGVTRVVVRDATGRETVSETPFYSSNNLLRENLWDYSAEIGLARLNYGTQSNDYLERPIASASVRYGVSDALTIAWHGEAGLGVINSGAAVTTKVGLFGTLEAGLNSSTYDGAIGAQFFAGFQGELGGITFNARTQRSVGPYTDVAAHAIDTSRFYPGSVYAVAPADAFDLVSVGMPIDWTGGNLNLSYVRTEYAGGDTFDIGSVSYSQSLTKDISMHATAFGSFSDSNAAGAYLGVTMSLGGRRSISSGVRHHAEGTGVTGTFAKSSEDKPGSFGWRVYVSQDQYDVARADVDYNAGKAIVRGSLAHGADGLRGSYSVDGAVAMTKDGVFMSRRIDDSFAVVDAGAPDVEVRVENRPAGRTGSSGKLLVTGLHAYQKNKITIDPKSLPVNADIPTTKIDAVPAARSGMTVRFKVDSAPKVALVEFRTEDGSLIAAGYTGKLLHSGAEFVIGYDGQAFIEGLAAENTVEITLAESTCRATFPFTPDSEKQVLISGVTCK